MDLEFDNVEFDTGNPEPRCPCVLLLDTSASMSGAAIAELNTGLQTFAAELSRDEVAMSRVEVAIVGFGPVNIIQDFVTAGQFEPPTLPATGNTPMGQAIELALDMLDQRKRTYRENGVSYFRPWVFMITDGAPTDSWKAAAARLQDAENNKKVSFFAVGVGGANMDVLSQIAVRQPLKLQGLQFREMFVWLSASLSSVSRSQPGEEVPLQTPLGWGSV